MSLEGSHWIRGYLYDANGDPISGATVTVSTITGTESGTETTTTTASGFYQLNVQHICDIGDLIKVNFDDGTHSIDEFVRVKIEELTQEINATLEGNFYLESYDGTINIYLPMPRWEGVDGDLGKNVPVFNFYSGEVSTVDKGISDEPLTISGWIWVDVYTRDTISGKVEEINLRLNDSEEFIIHGVNDVLDGNYVVKKFQFDSTTESPYLFRWTLQLEYAGE